MPQQNGLRRGAGSPADVQRTHCCTNDELWTYAKIRRVANVMRPYMQVIG